MVERLKRPSIIIRKSEEQSSNLATRLNGDGDCAEALNSDSALDHEVMQARVVCQGSFLKRRGQLTGAGEALKGPRPISLRLRPSPAFGVSRRSEGILSSRSVVVGATEGEGRGVRFAECVHGRGSAPR